MDQLEFLEACYQKYIQHLHEMPAESVIDVNLAVLDEMGLLKEEAMQAIDERISRSFHVIESEEKITLINDQFVVWIVPENIEGAAVTFTLIAINNQKGPKLEMVFSNQGVYNTSQLVLRVLEKALIEIQETQEFLKGYHNKPKV